MRCCQRLSQLGLLSSFRNPEFRLSFQRGMSVSRARPRSHCSPDRQAPGAPKSLPLLGNTWQRLAVAQKIWHPNGGSKIRHPNGTLGCGNQKSGIPKWVALGSGNMETKIPAVCPSCLILSHTHFAWNTCLDYPETRTTLAEMGSHTWLWHAQVSAGPGTLDPKS